ncbi:MAG: ABC transporter permease, partial [Thalassolituus sp.]
YYISLFLLCIEDMMVAPGYPVTILLGYIAVGVARRVAVGIIVTLLSLYFTELQVHHVGVMVAVVFLSAVLFSLGGFINAVFASKFDDIAIIPTFVITPLTYLGGVFYSISLLPDFWQDVSKLNPILYMVSTFRYGVLGVSDINVAFAFGMLVFFIVILGGYSIWLLRRGTGMRQ